MMVAYFKQHYNRKAENLFFEHLKRLYPNLNHINTNFLLNESYIDLFINTDYIIYYITNSSFISVKKKNISKEYLSKLPPQIKIAKVISDVSIDFVIEDGDNLTFIEFHERQHHRLSDYRLKPIFTLDNEKLEIPRFLQRLIKDIWRWQNLKNFKIIWYNWFAKNNTQSIKFQDNKNEEFVLNQRFKISISY